MKFWCLFLAAYTSLWVVLFGVVLNEWKVVAVHEVSLFVGLFMGIYMPLVRRRL